MGKVPSHIDHNAFGYKYPHDYPENYVVQQYLPDELKGRIYYRPKNNKYENVLNTTLKNIEKINKNSSKLN